MFDLLKQGLDRLEDLYASVTPEQYGKTTTCAGFDVKALLNHIVNGQYFIATAATGKTPDPGEPDLIGNDPLGAFKQAKENTVNVFTAPDILERTFTFPFGNFPGPMGFGLELMETWVHGWDLAKSLDKDPTIPDTVAGVLLEGFKAAPLDDAWRSGDAPSFGPEIKVPDGASLSDKLVAYLGRQP